MLGGIRIFAPKRRRDAAQHDEEQGKGDAKRRRAARRARAADLTTAHAESGAFDGADAECAEKRMPSMRVARGDQGTSGVETTGDDGEWLPAQHEDFTDDAVRDAVEESDVDDEIDSENVSNRLARWRNVKVGQELGARRAALADALRQAIQSVAPTKIHPHQRAAAMLLLERFCSGSPGTLFVMDCGLGKTHTMLLVAGALMTCKVRVVLASENLLASECKRVFSELWPGIDPMELNVIVSGHHAIHKTNAAEAFAQREREDAIFILDEASRYSDESGAMYEAIGESVASGYQPFRMLVTATPFTSNFTKLSNLLSLTGIVGDDERDEFKEQLMCAARTFVNVVKNVRDVHNVSATELADFCDELTVGRRALEDAQPSLVDALVTELAVRVRKDISVLTIPITQPSSFWTQLIATASTQCAHQVLDVVTKCELSDTFALRVTRELELEPPRGECMDASVNAIIHLICTMATEAVVVYVPSDLASGAWYVWTRLIAVMGPGKCAIIDQDTSQDERRRIIASFDEPVDKREYNVLFATTETSGFGINLPTVDNAIFLTSSWTSATNSQATHRNVRAFSNVVGPPRVKRLVLVMFVNECGSVALSRFSRAAIRGKVGAALFPPLLPMDAAWNLPLLATTETPLTVVKRNAIAQLFQDHRVGVSEGQVSYSRFLRELTKLAAGTECSVEFLFNGDSGRAHSQPRQSKKSKKSKKNKKRATRTPGGGLQFKTLHAQNDAERAVLAGIATRHATPTMTPEVVAQNAAQAARIKLGIERAQSALDRGETWLPSTSRGFYFFYPKNTSFDAPVRRMMITASSLSGTTFFPKRPVQQNAFMRTGVEFEATALKHIQKKYGFDMVNGVDKWTRALPSDPTVLAATLDGLTTQGIIVEVKFVHNFMDVLTPAGATKKYNLYWPQVQAQLHVFELSLAMLVFYSIDADTDDMFSCEYWIHRDDAWLDRMMPKFDAALDAQRKRHNFDPSSL